MARPGEVVLLLLLLLLSACASWDQFEDYEAWGRAFKALVAGLGSGAGSGSGSG